MRIAEIAYSLFAGIAQIGPRASKPLKWNEEFPAQRAGQRSSRRLWRRRLRFSGTRPSPDDAQADRAGEGLAAVGQLDIAIGEQRRLVADGIFDAEVEARGVAGGARAGDGAGAA